MALNACSINGFTLNSRRCADRFAALVPILHPTLPPLTSIQGTSNQSMRQGVHRDLERRWEIENDERAPLTFEQPQVTVSVEIFGFSGTDTQEVSSANVDFVTVHDLVVTASMPDGEITVNIPDFRFE
jgi:hypothetical protein